MRIRDLALAGVAAIAFATPALAGDGWYAGFGFGESWADGTIDGAEGNGHLHASGDINFGRAPVVEADYGYKWADSGWWAGGFRLEAELAYAPYSMHDIQSHGFVLKTTGNVNLTSAFLNAAWDWPIADKWAITFGGGIGVANVNADVKAKGFVAPFNKVAQGDDTAFTWQLLGGLTYAVDPNVDLQLDYRYQGVGDTRHDAAIFGATHSRIKDFNVQTVKLSIRWYYNYAPPPPPPAPTPVQTPPPAPKPPVVFIVFFDFDKSNLTAEAQSVVSEAVAAVKAGNVVHVMVTGHTDTVGSHAYNQGLSERRAASVKAEMIRLGLSDGMIGTAGRSFDDPMVQTGPGVREPQNRRAVIELGK